MVGIENQFLAARQGSAKQGGELLQIVPCALVVPAAELLTDDLLKCAPPPPPPPVDGRSDGWSRFHKVAARSEVVEGKKCNFNPTKQSKEFDWWGGLANRWLLPVPTL